MTSERLPVHVFTSQPAGGVIVKPISSSVTGEPSLVNVLLSGWEGVAAISGAVALSGVVGTAVAMTFEVSVGASVRSVSCHLGLGGSLVGGVACASAAVLPNRFKVAIRESERTGRLDMARTPQQQQEGSQR